MLFPVYIEQKMDEIDIELDEMELVAAAAGYYYYNSLTRLPRWVLPPGQLSYMEELLSSGEEECCRMLRMDKRVFLKLSGILRQKGLLRDTNGMMIEEQLAIFLNIIGHNERNRVIQDRFRHSGETISRHFNSVLKAIKSLSREFLQSPPQNIPLQILGSKRLHPYFQDCIGVVDCMRIPAHVPVKDQSRFRDKKGSLTQNILAACTFDLQFIFICPGWEGSASDGHVLRSVLDDPDQKFPHVPEDKYYLVDTAYNTTKGFMAPYQEARHQIDAYKGANRLPRSAKELFNHRHAFLSHSSLRTFDVLKERFPILKIATQYAFQVQRDVVIAACVIHNFIHREDCHDWLLTGARDKIVGGDSDDLPDIQLSNSIQDQIAMSERDSIASSMWAEFVNDWNEW
ncbi:hypothetical protein V2J09_023629 [Rumex salicifolius]